jgi:hypothetical protein
VTFSQPVATTEADAAEPNIIFYSPSSLGWFPAATDTTHAPESTVQLFESDGDTDCTIMLIIGQPAYLTAAAPFATGVQTPIT